METEGTAAPQLENHELVARAEEHRHRHRKSLSRDAIGRFLVFFGSQRDPKRAGIPPKMPFFGRGGRWKTAEVVEPVVVGGGSI